MQQGTNVMVLFWPLGAFIPLFACNMDEWGNRSMIATPQGM
jgi:hypothetical protein